MRHGHSHSDEEVSHLLAPRKAARPSLPRLTTTHEAPPETRSPPSPPSRSPIPFALLLPGLPGVGVLARPRKGSLLGLGALLGSLAALLLFHRIGGPPSRLHHLYSLLDLPQSCHPFPAITRRRCSEWARIGGGGEGGCEIPRLDPWDPSIASYVEKAEPLACKSVQPEGLAVFANGTLSLNVSAVAAAGFARLACAYQCFQLGIPGTLHAA